MVTDAWVQEMMEPVAQTSLPYKKTEPSTYRGYQKPCKQRAQLFSNTQQQQVYSRSITRKNVRC